MYKTPLKLTIIALSLILFNCKKNSESFNNYKYTTEENILVCDEINTKLYEEALLSFEDDITDKYDTKNKDIRRAYSFFTRDALANKVDYQAIVSPHTMEVFEAIKNDKDLWNEDNSINYNSDIIDCLSHNFKDKNLQTTFNALVSTNSMRSEIFGAPLIKHVKNSHEDRYMATYVALDLFYTNLFNVDPTKVVERPKAQNISTTIESAKSKPNKINISEARAKQEE
jgi:hypothetical protein